MDRRPVVSVTVRLESLLPALLLLLLLLLSSRIGFVAARTSR
jgi:hypothetical protein